jgi:glycosyltransferase involved in cell wall biosynthesis
MKVLYSRPLTAPRHPVQPAEFYLMQDEAKLSADFSRRFPRLGRKAEILAGLSLAKSLTVLRRDFDVVVTGRYGEFFALAQSLWRWGRRPHLLLDVEWYSNPRQNWRARLNRWIHRRIVRGATQIQVFCQAEARNYARHFEVDESKFLWIPYCTDDISVPEPVEPANFIFTSGIHQRDYRTLLSAVNGLPVEVWIAAPPGEFENLEVPRNVKLLGPLSAVEYRRTVTAARFVVLSLQPDILRRPGVITYVQAMRMGKCVVVNDPDGASSYIDHGETGFLVKPADPNALRAQIEALLGDAATVRRVAGNSARVAEERFSGKQYFAALERAVTPLALG